MAFPEALKTCILKSITFSGRAARSEFWWFTLAAAVVYGAVILFLDFYGVPRLAALRLVLVVVAVPWLAAAYRRLHDTGLPGWLVLTPLLLSVALKILFLAGWVAVGDSRPPDATVPAAGVLLLIAYFLQWLPILLWAILAYLLSRPTQRKTNRFGELPAHVK